MSAAIWLSILVIVLVALWGLVRLAKNSARAKELEERARARQAAAERRRKARETGNRNSRATKKRLRGRGLD